MQDMLWSRDRYLIFEFLWLDLKHYMVKYVPKDEQMDPMLTKSYLYQVMFTLFTNLTNKLK